MHKNNTCSGPPTPCGGYDDMDDGHNNYDNDDSDTDDGGIFVTAAAPEICSKQECLALYLQGSVHDVLDLLEACDKGAGPHQRTAAAETYIYSGPTEVPVLESEQNRLVVGSVQVCELREIMALLLNTHGFQVSDPSDQEVK